MESPENRRSSSHISAYFLPVKNISHLGFQDEETLIVINTCFEFHINCYIIY